MGVVHIMDKIIQHPEFTSVVIRIRHVAFVAREESGHNRLNAEVDSGFYDPNASDS